MHNQNPKNAQLRKRDASGRLIEAGFCWQEWRFRGEGVGWLFVLLFFVAFFSGGFFLACLSKGHSDGVIMCGLISAASVFCMWRLNHPDPESMREQFSTVFCADGSILTTSRNAKNPAMVPLEFRTDYIQSIQALPTPGVNGGQGAMFDGFTPWRVWHVDIHLEDGRTFCHAHRFITEEDARLVSVQLSMALDEIRRSQPR
jgi:hypothetical protein